MYYGSKKLYFLKSEIILAKQNSIPIKILNKYNEDKFMQYLINKKIDLIFIGGGWPSLISKFLRLKNVKIVNLHPSLLPNFKGTSVTRWQKFYNPKFRRNFTLFKSRL